MHVIHLRRPWEKQGIDGGPSTRIDVPELESAAEPGAGFRFRRRFHCPTGLDSSSRVRLRLAGWSGRLASLRINDQPLAVTEPPLEMEVTHLLGPSNVVEIELHPTSSAAAVRLSGEVALAIE